MVEVPIFCQLSQRKTSPKPGMVFSNTASKASGVTSRPVTPVPPVETTTSIAGSAIQRRSWASIAVRSSRRISRAATWWPSRRISSASVSPDLSLEAVLVSETVRTAILTGRNGLLSSSLGMLDRSLCRWRHWRAVMRARGRVQRHIGRPFVGGKRFEVRGLLSQALAIDPHIGQHALDIEPRGLARQRLDEQQRVALIFRQALPLRQRRRPAVIGGQHQDEIAVDLLVLDQLLHIFLAEAEIEHRVDQLGDV